MNVSIHGPDDRHPGMDHFRSGGKRFRRTYDRGDGRSERFGGALLHLYRIG